MDSPEFSLTMKAAIVASLALNYLLLLYGIFGVIPLMGFLGWIWTAACLASAVYLTNRYVFRQRDRWRSRPTAPDER